MPTTTPTSGSGAGSGAGRAPEKRDFLDMADLSPSKLGRILDLAAQLKRGEVKRKDALSRKVLAMVFLDPSLRTRTSFEVAMFLHGGHGVVLEPGRTSWAWETQKGVVMDGSTVEHIAEAARVLGRYADAVAMNLFPSRGLALHGFEIKVSKSDFKSEIENPEKSVPVQQYCDHWWIVAPAEAERDVPCKRFLDRVVADTTNPVSAVRFVDLRESMQNGGGPACLRLRVALTASERAAIKAKVFGTTALFVELESWVTRHYRDRLRPEDLTDPVLARESMTALDELTQILHLGSVYDFQRA